MSNRNPMAKFKKGQKKVPGSGRPPGQPNYLTADIRKLIRQAAEETGFITASFGSLVSSHMAKFTSGEYGHAVRHGFVRGSRGRRRAVLRSSG